MDTFFYSTKPTKFLHKTTFTHVSDGFNTVDLQ